MFVVLRSYLRHVVDWGVICLIKKFLCGPNITWVLNVNRNILSTFDLFVLAFGSVNVLILSH